MLSWSLAASLRRVATTGSGGGGAPPDVAAASALLRESEERAAQHPEHPACAWLLARLRAQPRLLARGLRRSGLMRARCPESVQEGAVQLLLCSLYGSRWHASDEQDFLRLAEVLCHG